MSKLAQLREQRNVKARAAAAINNKYGADQRMPADDAGSLDIILAEIEAIDAEITRENRLIQLAAETPEAQHQALVNAATREPGQQSTESRALRAFLSGGISNLAEEDRSRMLSRQSQDIRQAMSTTTSTEGGFTVASEYQRSLEQAMAAMGGVRSFAHMIRSASGADMNFPTTDATAEIGELVGQNVAVSAGDTTFGNTAMTVYKYSSKKIALPFELIQDSFIDIETYIQGLLAIRLGRITNLHYAVGTGSNQPRGIVTAAPVGKAGAVGTTTTIGYDDLVDLEHSVDPAYRGQPGVGFAMHDNSLKVLRKIKDGQNRPIFVPGYETGNPGGAPDRLMGRPINIVQQMPVMAANAKSVLFGQLSKYTVRDVMDLTVFRMVDSAFTLNGQVGFVAFMRSGGNLIDAGGAVKAFQNSAT